MHKDENIIYFYCEKCKKDLCMECTIDEEHESHKESIQIYLKLFNKWKKLLSIFILGIFQIGIPYILLGLGSRYVGPVACSLLGVFEPLLNPVWVLIFDGEKPGIFALIGAVIILTSITIWCIKKEY